MANSGNGGIIGVSNVVVNGCAACATASGVWELNTVYDYIKASDWVYNFASLDYLVIAGGGSSGGNSGGGGGAGGMLSSYPGGSKISIREGNVTTVTVGAGGAVASPAPAAGTKGNNSVLGAVTSIGGGYGAAHGGTVVCVGGPGGSGGGGAANGAGGSGTPGQGNNGGNYGGSSGGGGGGAGGAGTNAPGYPGGGGPGGNGLANAIAPGFPAGTTFGGGGGGHGQPGTAGTGGPGGGGKGQNTGGTGAVAGTDGLGGGAGGGSPGPSMKGGDGSIFVRMATACKPAAYAVAPGTNTVATVGCCTVATFTVIGTLTL